METTIWNAIGVPESSVSDYSSWKLFTLPRTMLDTTTIPDVHYRYQVLNANTLASLIDRTMWFADPRRFNDPFDCQFEVRDPRPGIDKTMDISMVDPEVIKQNFRAPLDGPPKVSLIEHYKERIEQSYRNVGVVCMAPTPTSALLWAHYADCHQGLCLRFETQDKERIFPANYDGNPGVIFAGDGYPHSDRNLQAILLNKPREWSYEEEYRLLMMWPRDTLPVRLVPWGPTLKLNAICLGLKMPEHQKQTIRNIFKDDDDVTINEMEQVPGQLAVRPKAEGGS